MTRRHRALVLALAAGAAFEVVLPPYFAMDTASGGRVHAALGHRPAWRPPSAEAALPSLWALPAARGRHIRTEDVTVRRNVVRIVAELLALALGGAVGLLATNLRRPGSGA